MNTIERYIFRRLLIAAIGATLTIVALVWTSQAVTRIDFASTSSGNITTFLYFMIQLIPQFIATVLPFALVVAVVQVFNTMNQDSETPVLASAGFGRWRLARPVLLLCIPVSLYVLISSHFIEPYSNARARDALTLARANLLTTLIEPGRFTKADKNLTIYVDNKDNDQLEGVMISDVRDPALNLLYFAKTGAVANVDGESLLLLNDGQIHRKTPNSKDITVIAFQSYAISLSQFSRADKKSSYYIYERSTPYLLNPDPNDRNIQSRPGRVHAELYRRTTDWLYVILMGLVGLVIAAKPRSHRGGNIASYILAFGTALTYRGAAGTIYNLNKVTADYLYLIYIIPLFGIAVSIWMYTTGRSLEIPQFLLDAYDKAMASVTRFRLRVLQKRSA